MAALSGAMSRPLLGVHAGCAAAQTPETALVESLTPLLPIDFKPGVQNALKFLMFVLEEPPSPQRGAVWVCVRVSVLACLGLRLHVFRHAPVVL